MRNNTYDYDLIVIGAGSGGLTAAIGAAGIGARVLLIEAEKLGGDCTHYGCIPSKALIKAAQVAHAGRVRERFGLPLEKDHAPINIQEVLARVRGVVDDVEERFEDSEKIRARGVAIIMGRAVFVDRHTIQVAEKNISAKKFIIATGAYPRELSIPGLKDLQPKTSRTIFEPEKFTSLIIIGTGPIGCELAQAFVRLGVTVTMIARDTRILSREEKHASAYVEQSLIADGVRILYNKNTQRAFLSDHKKCLDVVDRDHDKQDVVCADDILVAVGRAPSVKGLGLEKIGIEFDARQGIIINDKTQTTRKHIYAIGDVATKWKFTHYANHMAKTALANALLRIPARIDASVVPRVTFTTPEIGSVGVTYDDCNAKEQKKLFVFEKEYRDVDRAITDRAECGFVRLITDKKGMIQGATIVGGAAGEGINEVALAMKNGISIIKLSDTIHAYPTYGYGLRNCADQFRTMRYTKGKKKLVKKIFGLRGK